MKAKCAGCKAPWFVYPCFCNFMQHSGYLLGYGKVHVVSGHSQLAINVKTVLKS